MKRYKISFEEQSKAVVANVEIESEETNGEEILQETMKLMEQAMVYSKQKSLQKAI